MRLDHAASGFKWLWDEWLELHMRGGGWPRHVFLPSHAMLRPGESVFERAAPEIRAELCKMSQPQLAAFIGMGTMLGTWRISQGIYRIDPDLYAPLIDTPAADIPVAVLYRMPEWAIYIETPGLVLPDGGGPIHGAWVRHDTDMETGEKPLLSVVLDTDGQYATFTPMTATIPLGPGSVADCIAQAVRKWRAIVGGGPASGRTDDEFIGYAMAWMNPLMNLLLYICSTADFASEDAPTPPTYAEPVKTKRGLRLFPPPKPRQWDVGLRMGAALRATEAKTREAGDPQGGTVRPHMRRAHWHGVWTGPKAGPQRFKLNWLPPMPINMHVKYVDVLPAVIHEVRG